MNYWPDKDPDAVDCYYLVLCSRDGVNTGGATDTGELQGATISSATWTVPSGLTKASSNQAAVTIQGVAYAVNTVAAVWLSGGTDGVDYLVSCRIVTSDGRTLDHSVMLQVRAQ